MTTIIWAVVYADLRRDFFGAPGTLAEQAGGESVLSRTLGRLAKVRGLEGIALAAPPSQVEQVSALAGACGAKVMAYERAGSPAWRACRSARAFGRYGWRGGLAGTTIFDETFDYPLLAAVIEHMGAEAVMPVPAGAALLDVGLAEELTSYHHERAESFRMCFNQAPPGLSACILQASLVHDLARNSLYPGRLLAYDPSNPVRDPISQPYNLFLPQEVIATHCRFLADNPRGLWLLRQVLACGGSEADAQEVCRIARALPPEPWPREVTIELTTRRGVEDRLRPTRPPGDLPIGRLRAALAGLEEAGDVNVMFAGAGDALLHPDWPEAVALARKAGAVGLATYAAELDDGLCDRLLAGGVDLVQVYVDAVSDPVYAAHKHGSSAGQVWANIERLLARRQSAGEPGPLVVPTMLKSAANLDEQDEFFERCLRQAGWGVIQESTTAAGSWDDHRVVRMAPPTRAPCRRIRTRLTLLADGGLAACEEDLTGRHALPGETILDGWRSEAMCNLRELHAGGRWDDHPACAACEEFHRP